MKRAPASSPPGSPRLFSDAHAPAPPPGAYTANIDGASRGNPGPASYAVVIQDANGKSVLELGKKLGRETNNVAEYYALLAALDYAAAHGATALRVRSDSELLVRQIQGRYRVKSPDLKPLHERAVKRIREFAYFAIEHVPREMNREADALANAALDGRAPASPGDAAAHSPQTAPRTVPSTRRVRARLENGRLIPSEPLNLPEGCEVLLEIHPLKDA